MLLAEALPYRALPHHENGAHWFLAVRDLGQPVWLDSAWPFCQRGRYDIISAAPLTLIDSSATDSFAATQQQLQTLFDARIETPELPFCGGALGLFGYEAGRRLQRLPDRIVARPAFPDVLIGLYSWAIVVDHHNRQTTLVMRPETPAPLRRELLQRVRATEISPLPSSFCLKSRWRDEFPPDAYRSAFTALQKYIRAGDCYQVNLARRFSANCDGDPFAAYLQLRATAAAPFSAYLESEHGAVLSLSPERFLAAERIATGQHELLTQPIKGTAPRSNDPARDQQLATELQHSEKNRAENLMIVDLLRNDLGRSCKPGSIRVDQLFELQSFATVHHLVSSVRGELRDDLHALDALRNCFPGGSITGAPKIRAMQIIDELEPELRSVFCGAIGYVDVSGRMDTNITIRTLLACNKKIYAWAGGGIVADSQCDDELNETENKILALLNALSTLPE